MLDLIRIDLCHSGDEDTKARLLEVIAELGGRADGDCHQSPIGVGLQTFHLGADELTVYADAWGVDVAGPEPVVRRVLAAMAGL